MAYEHTAALPEVKAAMTDWLSECIAGVLGEAYE